MHAALKILSFATGRTAFLFPRDGYLRGGYAFSREALGADTKFEQFDMDALSARSAGNHSGAREVGKHNLFLEVGHRF